MKIPGWIYKTKWQKRMEPFKDFTYGICLSAQSNLDDQDYDSNPSFGSRHGFEPSKQPRGQYENSTCEHETKGVEDIFNEETFAVISEPFHGFLTIGTLGTEPITSEPATPTFATSDENISEGKNEDTEYDLKLINYELEKFLEAEAEKQNINIEASGRNSCVSIITLCDNPMEGDNSADYGQMTVCPLQGYLLGSSIEFPETFIEVKKEKASFVELLHRGKKTGQSSTEKYGKEEKPAEQNHISVKRLMQKMFKKFHTNLMSTTPSDSDTTSISIKKKLHKVMKMFHRKIHPQNSTVEKELNSHNRKIKSDQYDGAHLGGLEKGNSSSLQGCESNDKKEYHKTTTKLLRYEFGGRTSGGNKEQWIKTDADYLVLEL